MVNIFIAECLSFVPGYMKKSVAIFLTILYLASFSGMVLVKNCCFTQAIHITNVEGAGVCSVPGSFPGDKNHPLLGFDTLLTVHKEVLVSGYTKNFRAEPVSLVSTNHVFYCAPFPVQMHTVQTHPLLRHRLFIENRVLLI